MATEPGDPPRENQVVMTDEQGSERAFPCPGGGCVFHCAISPDGRWVAVGRHIGSTRVLDVRRGEWVKDLPEAQFSSVTFSPDSRWLVTGTGQEYRFWEVGSWQSGLRVERGLAGPSPAR